LESGKGSLAEEIGPDYKTMNDFRSFLFEVQDMLKTS
jgi:hypothetical protein